jgi:hypothetical protein
VVSESSEPLLTAQDERDESLIIIEEAIKSAVDKELEIQEATVEEAGVSYTGAFKARSEEQSMWEKCRLCYGKIVGFAREKKGDGLEQEYVLLDDVSNCFYELMQDEGFRKKTDCGFPSSQTVHHNGWTGKRKRQLFSREDKQTRGHRIISVPKRLLEPYYGVRGKAGAQNFVIDLLRARGWMHPASVVDRAVRKWNETTLKTFAGASMGASPDQEGAPPEKPPRYCLYGIFDVRHQPHYDFWEKCLPAFFYHNTQSFDYEVNDDVCLVQAPQAFASVRIVDDYLDVNNGLLFNMMNIIRNCVGGVTSCGTNGIWLVDARETWKEYQGEFFDSRSKIEDTASSHRYFNKGKRSVYMHKVCATGIAKLNAAYLGATQRWAEGAVQLFWIQWFVDWSPKMWRVLGFVLFLYGITLTAIYLPWWPYFWCCVEGRFCARTPGIQKQIWHTWDPTAYITYPTQQFCEVVKDAFVENYSDQWSNAIWIVSIADLIRLLDFAIWWMMFCFVGFLILLFCEWLGWLPSMVRTVIMFENSTYFWSSWTVLVWVGLSAEMVITNSTPFHYEVFEWMIFALAMQGSKYIMQQRMKNAGNCDEMSIWRSQQMFFVGAPLHLMSLCQGTVAAWGIHKHGLDKSFWSATDHGVEVVNFVKMWTTFILGSAAICVVTIIMAAIFFPPVGSPQIMSCILLLIMAITIWTPVLDIWGFTKQVNVARRSSVTAEKKSFKGICQQVKKSVAQCMMWGRSVSWTMRWAVDIGLPILFILFSTSGDSIVWLSAYAQTMGAMRI